MLRLYANKETQTRLLSLQKLLLQRRGGGGGGVAHMCEVRYSLCKSSVKEILDFTTKYLDITVLVLTITKAHLNTC